MGVKRNQDWIEEFTIAKVMFMTPINYLEFTDYDNLIFEFNHRNLVEKVNTINHLDFPSFSVLFLPLNLASIPRVGNRSLKEKECK